MRSFKCVLVGPIGVEESKTCLLVDYSLDLPESILSSLGTEFKIINDDKKEYSLVVNETTEQLRFKCLSSMLIRDKDVIIAVFSLTDKWTLDQIPEWVDIARTLNYPDIPIILCGTGAFIRDRNDRTLLENSEVWDPVSSEEGIKMQNKLSLQGYIEISKYQNIYLFEMAVKLAISAKEQEKTILSEKHCFVETISKDGIDFGLASTREAVVINVGPDINIIPDKLSIKLKKYPITRISFQKFFEWPTNEFHLHKNSNIREIDNIDLHNVIEMDIPPLLEKLDIRSIQSAGQLKTINILNPVKSKFKLLNDIFLINNQDKELIIALKCESAPDYMLTTVKSIYPYALAYFKIEMNNYFGNLITKLPDYCYFKSTIKKIVIPDTITIIGQFCFKDCTRLEDVIILRTSHLKIIKQGAFMETNIRTFTVTPEVQEIDVITFLNCIQLRKIKFDESNEIEKLDFNCFQGCSDDLIIKLSKNFKSLENIPKKNLFTLNLKQSQEIIVNGDMVFEKQGKRLFHVRNNNQEKLVIPQSVNEIRDKALNDLINLKEVEFKGEMEEFNIEILPPGVEKLTLSQNVQNIIGIHNNLHIEHSIKEERNIDNATAQEDEFDFEGLINVKTIGHGISGIVYLMKDPSNRHEYAIKVIHCKDDPYEINKTNFEREISTMKSVCHPCIVRFYGSTPWKANEEASVALEYYKGGSLNNYLRNMLSNTDKVIIFVGICIGMSHLHKLRIMHRDLKPQNVMIDEKKHPHIGDFGLSKFEEIDMSNTGEIGSPMYMAPELFKRKHCGMPADVYAFGILSFELLFGERCFPTNLTIESLKTKKSNNDHHSIPEDATPLARRIVESMISVDISSRPTFDEVLETVKSENYSLLPHVDIDAVRLYVAEVSSDVDDEDKNDEERVLGSEDSDFFSFNPIQMSEAIINFDLFENPRLIGRGRSGNVYLMTFRNQDFERDYVVKMRDHSKERGDQIFMREVEILCEASHPCTVRIFGFCFFSSEQEPARIAIEFYEHGTLFDLMDRSIRGERVSEFTPTVKAIIVVGVCYGMRFLHSLDIIHRNLNPKKIFLDSSYRPKIGGFGNSKFFDCENTMTVDGVFNSAAYVAPEASSHDYDSKVDVYSFGLILREISTNRWSNQRERPHSNPIMEGVSSLTAGIIDGCLESDPRRRLSFEDIIEHLKGDNFKLFDGINIEEVLQYAASIEKCEQIYL